MGRKLLVFALEQESQDVFDGYDVLYTGVGKVNAAYALTKYLAQAQGAARPSIVVNLGTAGSRKHAGGAIINAVSFVQRDMDATALGFAPFATPFGDDAPVLVYGQAAPTLTQGVCGSGDSFDTSQSAGQFDVVDMEAYPLALICRREKIPFLCLKYVSDGADGDSHTDWAQALHDTAEKLKQALEEAGL